MPEYIQDLYITFLKFNVSARTYLDNSYMNGDPFMIYRTFSAAWISEYVL